MMKTTRPRLIMALVGPLVGLVSGAVIGLFALIAAKLLKTAPQGMAASAS